MPVALLCALALAPHLLGLLSIAGRGGRLARALLAGAALLGLGAVALAGGSSALASPAGWESTANALARGRLAWVVLALPVLVILAPLWAATRLRRT